ncbi:MAG: AAA family ATPase, partial [Myxococcales bacterium]|nr:AAA family ATPase [Myxococcales bacterium]
ERIAAAPGPRGGIFVRLRGTKERVPLGSFGDGTTRLFSLACNLISVQGGLLLIDEIDTGLHVSTMLEMWAFLFHAVKEFDVQVFATTHSDDCIRGLTEFLRCDEDARGKARLFRMERGASTMTSYDSEEIVSTSDAGIEVR